MAVVREEWLALKTEEALDPGLPICDAHHHLWYQTDPGYTVEQYLQDISGGHNVVKTISVESRMMLRSTGPEEMKPVGETEFVQKIVSQSDFPSKINVAAGIVGFADLTLGQAVTSVLEAHIAAGKGRFKGIRQSVNRDKTGQIKTRFVVPENLLLDAKFREGFASLRKYSLSFDAWLFHPQLMELVNLARAFPDTTIILNHVGGPLGTGPYAGKRDLAFQELKQSLSILAGCSNVFVKLGGLGMEVGGINWFERAVPPDSTELAAAYSPYFLFCIERFGVKRCLFESNFPVEKRSCSFTILFNAFKKITSGFSSEERKDLFYNTAIKAYRI